MSKEIDVQELANQVRNEILTKYKEELAAVKEETKDKSLQNPLGAMMTMISGSLEVVMNHSERFTVQLVQKLVDELEEKRKNDSLND